MALAHRYAVQPSAEQRTNQGDLFIRFLLVRLLLLCASLLLKALHLQFATGQGMALIEDSYSLQSSRALLMLKSTCDNSVNGYLATLGTWVELCILV